MIYCEASTFPSLSIYSSTSLTLVLSEFATNAVKHGALGSDKGVVNVGWTVENRGSAELVRLPWAETNGPEIQIPLRQSGSKIIEKVISASGGAVSYDWAATGLVATIEFPVSA